MAANKTRLDVYVFESGACESREKAKALIMAGSVFVNGEREDKAGRQVTEKDIVEVRGGELPFVSRGGLKLEKAMESFPISPEGLVCADIGASTGGFTDCMLSHGAAKVYAVDVGYGQLAWKLRCDERVVNLERTNARYLDKELITEELMFFSVDVSFISLKLILPAVKRVSGRGVRGVCLIKPQFEAGKEKVGKNGVVRDPQVHREVIENVFGYAADNGFTVMGLTYSPVKGPSGNIEYLVCLGDETAAPSVPDIASVVEEAHSTLKG